MSNTLDNQTVFPKPKNAVQIAPRVEFCADLSAKLLIALVSKDGDAIIAHHVNWATTVADALYDELIKLENDNCPF